MRGCVIVDVSHTGLAGKLNCDGYKSNAVRAGFEVRDASVDR